MQNKIKILGVALAGVLCSSVAFAQFFDNGTQDSSNQSVGNQPQVNSSNAAEAKVANQQPTYANRQLQQSQQAQQIAQPTPVNAYNGRNPITFVSQNGRAEKKELIMLYMKDFKIYQSPSGQTRCSVQFAVATSLPMKLNNISYRLQWPELNTVVSFSNVQPFVENHYNYSLLGKGCYSMDRTPNIIIQRCRAKGLSQRDCASKVTWITRVI